MLLGISILYNSIVYLLATSTLTWRPLILFIDSVENPRTQIGTFVALGAGLTAISLGQLSRTVLDFLDPCANPLSVVNRLADSIDPESISSEVVLSAEDTLFAILNKYIIKSIRESRVDEYSKAIRAIETITETLLNEIEDVGSNLFQLFGADDSFDSEERDKLLQRRHKLKDSQKGSSKAGSILYLSQLQKGGPLSCAITVTRHMSITERYSLVRFLRTPLIRFVTSYPHFRSAWYVMIGCERTPCLRVSQGRQI